MRRACSRRWWLSQRILYMLALFAHAVTGRNHGIKPSGRFWLPSKEGLLLLPRSRVAATASSWCQRYGHLRGGYGNNYGYDDNYYGLDDGWNGEAYVGESYEYEQPPPSPPRRSNDFEMPRIPIPDRKTGFIMVAAGAAFTMLGISLFFEKNLIRLGNLLLVVGAPIVVGPRRASRYLFDPSKLRGSIVFGIGFLLILSGHPLLGIVVEVFGFLNLFGNLFPLIGAMLTKLPFMVGLSNLAPKSSADLDPNGMY